MIHPELSSAQDRGDTIYFLDFFVGGDCCAALVVTGSFFLVFTTKPTATPHAISRCQSEQEKIQWICTPCTLSSCCLSTCRIGGCRSNS